MTIDNDITRREASGPAKRMKELSKEKDRMLEPEVPWHLGATAGIGKFHDSYPWTFAGRKAKP